MPILELTQTLVEKKVDIFCKKRVPSHLLHEINLSYKIRGNRITIFENRAPWHPNMKEWTSMPIAQIRFNEKSSKWTLYCADRNDKWQQYY